MKFFLSNKGDSFLGSGDEEYNLRDKDATVRHLIANIHAEFHEEDYLSITAEEAIVLSLDDISRTLNELLGEILNRDHNNKL